MKDFSIMLLRVENMFLIALTCDNFTNVFHCFLLILFLNIDIILHSITFLIYVKCLNMDTLNGIVEIFTFMKPLIRLRRNPYVRKPVHKYERRVKRKEKNRDKNGLCVVVLSRKYVYAFMRTIIMNSV